MNIADAFMNSLKILIIGYKNLKVDKSLLMLEVICLIMEAQSMKKKIQFK
jgi:hypothetical protein